MVKNILLSLIINCFVMVSAHANEVIKLSDYAMKLSIETTASKPTIWHLWEDVENWKSYDKRLEYSYLVDGASFETGAIGYVKGMGAPKSKFVLVKVVKGESFTEILKLPLWQTIHLKRYFEKDQNGNTVFSHEVQFKGRMKSIFHWFLAKPFKKDLKKVMLSMKTLAENTTEKPQ